MARSKARVPKTMLINIPKLRRAIGNALEGAAKGAKVDFDVTTRTWNTRPKFTISKPSEFERIVATDNNIYAMLNEGTKPHDIKPKRPGGVLAFRTPFRSKTIPNEIRSRKGKSGTTEAFAKVVRHPGTKARNWTRVIGKKWERQLPTIMQRAIDSEVS